VQKNKWLNVESDPDLGVDSRSFCSFPTLRDLIGRYHIRFLINGVYQHTEMIGVAEVCTL